MPKRELHRFHVRAPFKQRGRKLVIRLKDIQASALESPRVPKAEEEAWQDEHEVKGRPVVEGLPMGRQGREGGRAGGE